MKKNNLDFNSLVSTCKNWFSQRAITDAVVGFSGGVDSAVTAALLSKSGIKVHLVVSEAPNQKYSSSMGGFSGASAFVDIAKLNAVVHKLEYDFMFLDPAANEAAAPIQRIAGFYGVCASLKSSGRKGVVVGTANFDEAAYMGFWGKASDGAQDFYPISHLHKSHVYEAAKWMTLPSAVQTAIPSGDLLFTKTNDLEMMGATYGQIESLVFAIENQIPDIEIEAIFKSVDSPEKFCKQIVSNGFKYELPFGGFHLSDRLETFRLRHYQKIFKMAQAVLGDL